ncbi:MAG: FtsQ-type POTRA domain-containing protein, partial [Clostridia bacterium]|nr:FtsQ-type POTRA domain-containing protein [Clostridia bacterium]
MGSRRLPTILIAVAFFIVVVFSCIFAFTVSDVHADFWVSGEFDAETVQNKLDGYKGKNLIFFNAEEIKTELEKDPAVEVISIRKEFPNVLWVSVKERIESFRISQGGETLVLSEEGYVLKKSSVDDYSADKLFDLTLNGIT